MLSSAVDVFYFIADNTIRRLLSEFYFLNRQFTKI